MLAKIKNLKAQVWVETAIYTVIGLAIIGVILAVANPAIEKHKDRIVIEQTIDVLNDINEKILETQSRGFGNKRIIPEIYIKRGTLTIDGEGDRMTYLLEESRFKYSEIGAEIREGDITIITQKRGRKFDINMTINYENLNITYNGEDTKKIISQSPSPYKLSIENSGVTGEEPNKKIWIDIKEEG